MLLGARSIPVAVDFEAAVFVIDSLAAACHGSKGSETDCSQRTGGGFANNHTPNAPKLVSLRIALVLPLKSPGGPQSDHH